VTNREFKANRVEFLSIQSQHIVDSNYSLCKPVLK